jgi:hypothetical protein
MSHEDMALNGRDFAVCLGVRSNRKLCHLSLRRNCVKGGLCKPEGTGPFPAVIYNHVGISSLYKFFLLTCPLRFFAPQNPTFPHLQDERIALD